MCIYRTLQIALLPENIHFLKIILENNNFDIQKKLMLYWPPAGVSIACDNLYCVSVVVVILYLYIRNSLSVSVYITI